MIARIALLACCLAAPSGAQQLKLNLDHLAPKARDTVDLTLGKNMLQLAASFLGSDAEEAKVKTLIAGLEGIYVKSFEFKTDGAWTPADAEQIRSQLKAPEWNRMVGVKSGDENENVEVWLHMDAGGKVTGLALLTTSPREFTVANIVGNISLESLADLGGQFGIPRVRPTTPAQPKKKE
jgi:hypothetical protein